MAKVAQGLRDIAKRETLPEGQYHLKVNKVRVTQDGSGEYADCVVLEGPDPETHGKHVSLYLMNEQANNYIGLSQLLASQELLRVPDGECGDGDTQNLIGIEFDATVIIGPDKKSGADRNYVNPIYDAEWYNKVMSGEIAEEKKTAAKKGKRR